MKKRADHKTFMLRNLDVGEVNSLADFRHAILAQFGDKLVDSDSDFNFGFYKGTKQIWVRNDQD